MPKGNGKPIPRVEVNLKVDSKENLINLLKSRFVENQDRHKGLKWEAVQARLEANDKKLASLNAMETTGGEPDVIGFDDQTDEYLFADCSAQTPNRRSICYDQAGEDVRKKKGLIPGGNAVALAKAMGIELLDEDQYRHLQTLGEFDTTTSSWIKTPANIRKLGGALFGDRRYNTVFIYHNGAESFYSARGFRGLLRV